MDVPLNADVNCADGPAGRSTTIILNPISSEVTHVVVKAGRDEFMVPLDLIVESTPSKIQLRCTNEEPGELSSCSPQITVRWEQPTGFAKQGVRPSGSW
jgi:hypothetical protein